MTSAYTSEQRATITWEQFSKTFCMRYVPLVDWERLAQEYLDLRQGTETVYETTKMFTEKTLFCPKCAASE